MADGGRSVDEIWRYVAMCAVTACVSLVLGQFLPNRNIVTTDQLNTATTVLSNGQNEQAKQIRDLSNQVATLTGALEEESKLRARGHQ